MTLSLPGASIPKEVAKAAVGSSNQSGIRDESTASYNIAPIGVNVGAILQPYTDSVTNGGFGLSIEDYPHMFKESKSLFSAAKETKSLTIKPLFLIGSLIALVIGFILLRFR